MCRCGGVLRAGCVGGGAVYIEIRKRPPLSPVGASLLAMVVNENACLLDKRGVPESIASRLAPTGELLYIFRPPIAW
ncbi:hypothetical protein D3C76_1681230 [compost metagenome]